MGLIDPFAIMLTVPLAITGAVLISRMAGGTINVHSKIGLVMIEGLITKRGTLTLIRKSEYGPENAAIEAAKRSYAENLCNIRVNWQCGFPPKRG
jgi:multidrug efflux pump